MDGTPKMDPIHINPLKYPSICCDNCGCETFIAACVFKKIPGLEVGYAGRDVTMPIDVYVCSKCGELMPEYKAPKDKEEEEQEKEKTKLIL